MSYILSNNGLVVKEFTVTAELTREQIKILLPLAKEAGIKGGNDHERVKLLLQKTLTTAIDNLLKS